MSLLQNPLVKWTASPNNKNRYLLSTLNRDGFSDQSQGRVLGDITVERNEDGSFRVLTNDYNFDQKRNPDNKIDLFLRNLGTRYGEWRVGDGTSFTMKFEGTFRPTSTQVNIYNIK